MSSSAVSLWASTDMVDNIKKQISKKLSEENNKVQDDSIFEQSATGSNYYQKLVDEYKSSVNSNAKAETAKVSANEANTAEAAQAQTGTLASESDVAALEKQFEKTQKTKGWLGKAIDGVCNFFGTKNSSKKVKETIEKAKNGEISLEEATAHVQKHAQKAKSTTNTVSNIVSGLCVVGGLAAAPFTGGLSLGVVATGVAIGAGTKVALKASDAMTNKVDGDYGAKELLKDGVSGGVSGGVTVLTAGMGTGLGVAKEGGKVLIKETIKQGAVAGAKAGAIDGAVMGATDYTLEAATEKDVDFTFGGLVNSTATGAVTGAIAGGIAGGATGAIKGVGAKFSGGKNLALANDTTGTTNATDVAAETANAAGETVQEAAKETTKKGILKRTTDLFSDINAKRKNIQSMSKKEIYETITGKANATKEEFTQAFKTLKETKEYANPAFRNVLQDFYAAAMHEEA